MMKEYLLGELQEVLTCPLKDKILIYNKNPVNSSRTEKELWTLDPSLGQQVLLLKKVAGNPGSYPLS